VLEELFYLHKKTLEGVPRAFKRYLYHDIDWSSACICVSGPRGVGKTTLLLQHYYERYNDVEKCLYVSADNVEVSALGLFNLAKEYFNYGGSALIIDEVHKYPSWQTELKNIIDTFKTKKVLFSGSSSLDLQEGKADLSRRAAYYHLKGLSFREYLELKEGTKLSVCRFPDLLNAHVKIAQKIVTETPILKHFRDYLTHGYYPFFKEGERTYLSRILNIIEKVLYEDIATLGNMKRSNIIALKKMLWVIATTVPFSINIDKMSRELGLSKEYVYAYLEYLEGSGLINSLYPAAKGYKITRKPLKVYLENTNLLFAINNFLRSESELGAVRETFFVNQIKDLAKIAPGDHGDFTVNGKYHFEIGGKGKDFTQIKGVSNAYIAADRIEIGHGNKIPLYIMGLLY